MSDLQKDVLDHIARVIGGTVSPTDPRFYSGAIANDLSGIPGINGCFSAPPSDIGVPPVAILLPAPFKAQLMAQGEEDNVDEVRLLLLVATSDMESNSAQLISFRDVVPDAFRANMRAFLMPDDGYAFVSAGDPGAYVWGGQEYFGWLFTISVQRYVAVTYAEGPTS